MPRDLFVLSAGAAEGVVLSQQAAIEAQEGVVLRATFGSVGAMRDQWAAGAPCDVRVPSAKLLDELSQRGDVDAATRVSLGRGRHGRVRPHRRPGSIGCTQVTEILYTDGVRLAGVLPAGSELSTEYAAAVVARAAEPEIARRVVQRSGGAPTLAVGRAGGFEA
jgi:ABC-type molybdate transport system substrate-binding protein